MGNEQAILLDREPRVHRITVEEFLALDEAGFFEGIGRVELIEGEIIEMSPLHLPHSRAQMQLSIAVGLAVDQVAGVEALPPVSAELDRYNLPEADIVIANVAVENEDKFVTTKTVRLLIEVASSSLRHDLGRKQRLYARTGVPEYWVVDVNGRTIIRLYHPEGETYGRRDEFAFGDPVPAATIAGLTVNTARLA